MPDTADELRHHGGNLAAARRRFPGAPEPWVDLSTGINPFAYPIGAIPAAVWTRLPEPPAVAALEAAASLACGGGEAVEIVAGAGSQAFIQLLPRLLGARRVGILGFTYGEHERSWRAAGAETVIVDRLPELGAFDIGVVVNPNNPDGRVCAAEGLLLTARHLARHGGVLVVDEAFIEAEPRAVSLIPHLTAAAEPSGNVVVLRSFGKIFGLAGLRLGFAATHPNLARGLREALGPWPVSGPATEIGKRALEDTLWLSRTSGRLAAEAARLDRLLRSAGFEILGGTTLFRLVAHEHADVCFERLGAAGILVRAFSAAPHWLRFGLPGGPAEWGRLEAALGCRAFLG